MRNDQYMEYMSLVDRGAYRELFIERLGWSNPTVVHPLSITVGACTYALRQVAQFKGIGIWSCEERPDAPTQRLIELQLSRFSTDHLVIFSDGTRQDWRWPRRRQMGGVNAKLLTHTYDAFDRNRDDRTFAKRLQAIELPFDDSLSVTDVLTRMRTAFDAESESASSRAAALMGHLYELVGITDEGDRPSGDADSAANATQLLARLLFLFFADDTDMWPHNLFLNWVRRETTSEDFSAKLADLFDVLAVEDHPLRAVRADLDAFPYVNGGIFAEHIELPHLTGEFRRAVIAAADDFDWSEVSPAIFGSMFQTVKSSEARRALGEHYTTEPNINKLLGPLFMDELHQRYEDGYNDSKALKRLLKDLGEIQVLDPACGCGNFLVVAYRDMRALELDVLERLQQLDPGRAQTDLFAADLLVGVKLDHFHGIEIEEWPARIASTALYLTRHLANMQMQEVLGLSPAALPLEKVTTIHIGNALRMDWGKIVEPNDNVRIVGNPPFLGPHSRTKEQETDLQRAWGNKNLGRLDYVTGWYKKAVDYFHDIRGGRFAFVSTNSIAQGDQAQRLFPPIFAGGWRIRFAHRTFAWSSEAADAAAVHCVIVGFDRLKADRSRTSLLFRYQTVGGLPQETRVKHINAYLLGGSDVIVTSRSTPLAQDLRDVILGSMAKDGGHLIIGPADYPEICADPIAVNYIRPYVGSQELLHGQKRWCLWLDGADPSDIQESPILKERVEAVRQFRLGAKASSTNDYSRIPHLFTQRAAQNQQFVCIPRVSSENRLYLPVELLEPDVIASDADYQIVDPDGFQFAILSSGMLIAWQKAIGGRLKSDIRFAVRTVWNNLPLPPVGKQTRQAIIEAGSRVQHARALHPKRSLAEHYNPHAMAPALLEAHRALDDVVDRAFGATGTCDTNEERQAILFDRYLEMTHGNR